MPRSFTDITMLATLICVFGLLLAAGFAPVAFLGIAWGILITGLIGWLIGHFAPGGMEGAYGTLYAWVAMAIGFLAGVIFRIFFA